MKKKSRVKSSIVIVGNYKGLLLPIKALHDGQKCSVSYRNKKMKNIFQNEIILTLQASTQNGMKQQIHITVKNRIAQISHVKRPDFFSVRVTILFPHDGHVH